MYSTEFSKESLRKIAEQKVNFRITIKIHICLFLLGNFLLFLINWFYTPEFMWFVIPLFSWLIGLVVHVIAYFLYARGVYPMVKRGLIYIFFAYVFGMLQLLVINYITSGDINWAIIPMIFGGTAVLIYLFVYLIYFKDKKSKPDVTISRKEKAIEKELEKMEKKLEQTRNKR